MWVVYAYWLLQGHGYCAGKMTSANSLKREDIKNGPQQVHDQQLKIIL